MAEMYQATKTVLFSFNGTSLTVGESQSHFYEKNNNQFEIRIKWSIISVWPLYY